MEVAVSAPPGVSPSLRSRADVIRRAVSGLFDIPVEDLETSRRAPAARARQSAIYLAHVALGLTYAEAGRLFGRDRSTAAHACRTVEDRRDDPRVDAALTYAERFICTELGAAQ